MLTGSQFDTFQAYDPSYLGGVTVEAHGNLLAATTFLAGLAVEDLPETSLLDAHDPDYPVVITAVARRAP